MEFVSSSTPNENLVATSSEAHRSEETDVGNAGEPDVHVPAIHSEDGTSSTNCVALTPGTLETPNQYELRSDNNPLPDCNSPSGQWSQSIELLPSPAYSIPRDIRPSPAFQNEGEVRMFLYFTRTLTTWASHPV